MDPGSTKIGFRAIEEQPGLMLNYFSLHERCFKLLDAIRSELHDSFLPGLAHLHHRYEER